MHRSITNCRFAAICAGVGLIVFGVVTTFAFHFCKSTHHPATTGLICAADPSAFDGLDPAAVRLTSSQIPFDEPLARRIESIQLQIGPLESQMSAAYCLHLLCAYGFDAHFDHPQFSSGIDLLSLFTDDEKSSAYFGTPTMIRTRYGIRQPIRVDFKAGKNSIEAHCDQFLACMAQLGASLTMPMTVGADVLSLRDVLRDSVANFHLRQREIEWTAIAYASYLSSCRVWENKFGERFTFDQLADELLQRNLHRASCCGSHIVEALILLLRVNDEHTQLLTDEMRLRVRERLQELVSIALANQRDDGSWDAEWFRLNRKSDDDSFDTFDARAAALRRLLPTSHLPHWMLLLPAELKVPDVVLCRAAGWCCRQLEQSTRDDLRTHFCPLTHATSLLRHSLKPDLTQ